MTETKSTKAGERTQQTQGPWHMTPDSTCSGAWFSIRPEGDDYGDYEICRTATFATSAKSKTYVEDPRVWKDTEEADEIRANARLIAAAPELLQTICDIQHNAQVMNQAEPNRVWTAIDDACRAAIAKAEGKE